MFWTKKRKIDDTGDYPPGYELQFLREENARLRSELNRLTRFDPNPRFVNHMCHWPVWAKRFENDADYEKNTLAKMLGFALEEIDRLCKKGVKEEKWASYLQHAYVMTCEALCGKCREKIVPIQEEKETPSVGQAFKYIEILNRWRAEKKFGGLEP